MSTSATKTHQSQVTISPFNSSKDLDVTKSLFTAYAASLKIDLSFQSFASELDSLPGKYDAPDGALFLARHRLPASSTHSNSDDSGKEANEDVLGCVALRPLPLSSAPAPSSPSSTCDDRLCEMKRLYVNPSGRGRGVGRALCLAVISEARRIGYAAMRLDTLPHMAAARALYKEFGFIEIDAYYDTPLQGTIFLELRLDGGRKTYGCKDGDDW